MSRRQAAAVELLRGNPSLKELREAYPGEWEAVERDLGQLMEHGDADALKTYLRRLSQPPAVTPGRRSPRAELVSREIRRRMAAEAVRQAYVAATTGVTSGRVRFNLVNGYLAQKLLFRRDLERKPVSMTWFRAVWPLLRQRRLLMPLVTKKGIYCFYSKPFVAALADLIGTRSCLEIGAGDGTLARFLTDCGVDVTATDDFSWSQFIQYPDTVLHQDAATALRTRRPEVVICSWPPADNPFERHVFTTASVQTYVMIGSTERASAGNWDAYEHQQGFAMTHDKRLSRLVLPPEIEPAVYVFERSHR